MIIDPSRSQMNRENYTFPALSPFVVTKDSIRTHAGISFVDERTGIGKVERLCATTQIIIQGTYT